MFTKLTSLNLCNLCIKKKKKCSAYFLKIIRCTIRCHDYPTNFSLINFSVPRPFLKTTRFTISARDPILWNNCLSKNEKEIDNFLLFKQRAKEKIMELRTAANFFQ